MSKKIVALGGGGFSMEPDNPLLDHFVCEVSGIERPKVCFLPTASGDSAEYIQRFYNGFDKSFSRPSHLSLFKPFTSNIESFLLKQHVIYVGGGNTFNMLTLWKAWGVDKILKKAYDKGIILAGLSAGAICWFEQGLTDSFGGKLAPLDCLSFLSGSCCPHYDGEGDRRPRYTELISHSRMKAGFALDDGCAVLFEEGEQKEVVSSRPNASGHYVTAQGEQKLTVRYLG